MSTPMFSAGWDSEIEVRLNGINSTAKVYAVTNDATGDLVAFSLDPVWADKVAKLLNQHWEATK